MSGGLAVFLIGLFGVPLVLLTWGHRLRRRGPRSRAAFWGAVSGHCLAGILAVTLGMIPPEAWTGTETLRGVFGFYSLIALPVAGAVLAGILARTPQ